MKLIVAPLPDQQRGTPEFLFRVMSQIHLTTTSQPYVTNDCNVQTRESVRDFLSKNSRS